MKNQLLIFKSSGAFYGKPCICRKLMEKTYVRNISAILICFASIKCKRIFLDNFFFKNSFFNFQPRQHLAAIGGFTENGQPIGVTVHNG